jgi:hypothetical protein
MNTTLTDVMIHINEPLSAEARAALENAMREIPGVVSPGFNAGKAHLLIVTYDAEQTRASVLLEKARAAGYTAQVVGM